MFQDIKYEEYETFGFPYEEFSNVDAEIRTLLKNRKSMQGVLLANQLSQCFPNHGYFAFSALNVPAVKREGDDGITYSIVEEDPEMLRVEEPLFWILNKMGVVARAEKKQYKKKGLFGFGK